MTAGRPAANALYRDPTAGTDERIADLLGRMTLTEKLGQLGSVWAFEIAADGRLDVAKGRARLGVGIGQITRVSGSTHLRPADAAALGAEIQRFLIEETRLGIPAIIHEECLHGVVGRDQVCYPQAIGLAATWDPDLIQDICGQIGARLAELGVHQGLAPILDVARDPRWGRIEETFGEDPYLIAELGVAYIRGLQARGVLATVKHLVGHGLPEGGMNRAPVHLGPRELAEVYLFPFEAAVRVARVGSVMHAYNDLDGVPAVASRWLLTEVLRDDWGFDGIVVSDYDGIEELVTSHQIAADASAAAGLALAAGVDVELPSTHSYGEALAVAVARGDVDQALVDDACGRVLRAKFGLGLMDGTDQVSVPVPALLREKELALARLAAQRSIVLLENDGVLPLGRDVESIAVIGPSADSARNLVGDYSYEAHLEALIEMDASGDLIHDAAAGAWALPLDLEPRASARATVLQAIRDHVALDTVVRHERGVALNDLDRSQIGQAVDAASRSAVAILVLGERSGLTDECTCGEARDRTTLGLPGCQQDLLDAVLDCGTPVVVVLVGGRPLAIERAVGRARAILHAWLPGDEGAEAIADVLFGDAEPGGRLPVTVLRSAGQVPAYYAHKPSGGRSHWKTEYVDSSNLPLWPFGHGAGYTRFELANARVEPAEVGPDGSAVISVEITNAGQRNGDCVVQVYARQLNAAVTRPVRQLIGFRRVGLERGARARVDFRIWAEQLGYVGLNGKRSVHPGIIQLEVGTSAADCAVPMSIRIMGNATRTPKLSRFFSESTAHAATGCRSGRAGGGPSSRRKSTSTR